MMPNKLCSREYMADYTKLVVCTIGPRLTKLFLYKATSWEKSGLGPKLYPNPYPNTDRSLVSPGPMEYRTNEMSLHGLGHNLNCKWRHIDTG